MEAVKCSYVVTMFSVGGINFSTRLGRNGGGGGGEGGDERKGRDLNMFTGFIVEVNA